jgi:hypothetical protein
MNTPRKALPTWFEPLCIGGFCVTALIEWNHGEAFWAYLFAISAFAFAVTAFWKKIRR